MNPLKVIAVASSEEVRSKLHKQLQQFHFVEFDGVVLELADAQSLWHKQKPDLLIIDMTDRELDACLFVEVINYNLDNKTLVFALHRELDPNIIVKAVSCGVKEFIQYPANPEALKTALEKHWNFLLKVHQSQNAALANHSKLIPVFGSKGGVGASTVAINTAQQLAELTRKPVALLDMDQTFSNTAVMLNFKASYALSDLVTEKPEDIDDALFQKILVKHTTGLDIIVACKSVLDENPMIPPELIDRVLLYLREHYAYIVVDMPSHVVDPYHQHFVEAAEMMLLVSSLDIPGLYRTRQYIELLKQHLDTEKIKLVLNRWDLKASVGLSNEALEAEFKYPIYARIPNNWQLNVEAMSLGQSLGQVSPQSDIVMAFQTLASELSGVELNKATQPEAQKQSGGLLSRLTRRAGVPNVAG